MAEERRRETNNHDEQHEDQEPPPADPLEPLVHTPKGSALSVRLAPQRSPNTAQNWRSVPVEQNWRGNLGRIADGGA